MSSEQFTKKKRMRKSSPKPITLEQVNSLSLPELIALHRDVTSALESHKARRQEELKTLEGVV